MPQKIFQYVKLTKANSVRIYWNTETMNEKE